MKIQNDYTFTDCWFDPWAFGHSYTFYNALLSCDDSYAMSCGNGSSSNTSEDDQNAGHVHFCFRHLIKRYK